MREVDGAEDDGGTDGSSGSSAEKVEDVGFCALEDDPLEEDVVDMPPMLLPGGMSIVDCDPPPGLLDDMPPIWLDEPPEAGVLEDMPPIMLLLEDMPPIILLEDMPPIMLLEDMPPIMLLLEDIPPIIDDEEGCSAFGEDVVEAPP